MTVCLLLAAGSSSRMGQPKMLLPYRGKSFLQHIIDESKILQNTELLVVTGCYHSLLQPILQQQQITAIYNEQWQNGMGCSIQVGINYLLQHHPAAAEVIILVCDQPKISVNLLKSMLAAKQSSRKGIIACSYAAAIGTPVLFDKKYFNYLVQLQGQQGAKKLVSEFLTDSITINFPAGAMDIDHPADYKNLLSGLLDKDLKDDLTADQN